jgi:hypothetical protein
MGTEATASSGMGPSPPQANSSSPSNHAPGKEKEDNKVSTSAETKGWLYKWTNYIKGYQKRWFVLANGLLSYYRNQAEMAHTCRGTISLHGAHIHTEDSCNFIVSNGGGTQTFHLRASTEVERQRWVTALELAKARAIQRMESEDDESIMGGENDGEMSAEIDKAELTNVVKTLGSKLEDLQTCHDLIVKHGLALQRSLSELGSLPHGVPESTSDHHRHSTSSSSRSSSSHAASHDQNVHNIKMKAVNERATLFKITSNAMINASSEFIELCSGQGRKWQKLLSNEREIRLRLEDMVEQLAKQHSHLENMVRKEIEHQDSEAHNNNSTSQSAAEERLVRAKSPTSGTNSEDDELFEDARDDNEICFFVPVPPTHRRTSSEESQAFKSESSRDHDGDVTESDEEQDHSKKETFNVVQRKNTKSTLDETDKKIRNGASKAMVSAESKSLRVRRTRIPERPNISFSLWSIMKNCIGKDLSRIPVPVNFSEPLSMLQRIVEDFEYAEILDKAALCDDNCEQLAFVAAFTVSAFSTTAIRTSKPFNPLLGETYECDRIDDKGWKLITEQVSHHPPMLAQHCESNTGLWSSWQEFTMRSKFKGKYLEVEPLGISHLVFPKTGNHYTWRKVKTVVHNIVLGKLWIDQHGEMEILNHKTADKCHMKFEAYSYFGGQAKKVTGTVMNSDEKVEWVLNGTWDAKLEGAKVIGESKAKGKSTSLEVGPSRSLWISLPDPESEKYYNFSKFACELNEFEEGVAPTDSRLRPDQRLMEDGKWDAANAEKVRLEEKQRAVRRLREVEAERAAQDGITYEGYQATWFHKVPDEQNGGKLIYVYNGGYWDAKQKQDWSACPDIYN